jgi:4-amino-4-deoxy-L-arabinose transferase-like glycosyltransferase
LAFRFRSLVIPTLLVIVAGALYLPRRDIPSYLAPDEVFSALTARSVATSGRDLNGRLLPLYFQLPESFETRMWYQPIAIYAMAASAKLLPFSESTVRLPMTIAAIVDILLAYCVALVLFRNQAIAVAAAALLALTPAHFSDSRVAMDHHSFLPFILGWLLCVLLYLERRKPYLLFAAGLVLGFGLFTYIASYVLMPAFALFTAIVLFHRREPLRAYALLAGGFLLPVLVGALYIASHPAVVTDTLWRYQRNQSREASGLSLVQSFFLDRVARVGSVYASFWRPRVLFISGPRAIWVAGQFVLPVAGLLVAGAMRMLRRADVPMFLLLAGLLIAPLPASFVGEPEVIRRAAGVMPFVVLIAAAGLDFVWTAPTARLRRMAFVAASATVIALAMIYYQDVPHAQAVVRAATVPIAIAGLAVLFSDVPLERLSLRTIAIVSVVTIGILHAVYFVSNQATPVGVVLLVSVMAMTLLERPPGFVREPLAAVALLVLVVGHFMFNYVDYVQLRRIAFIPASVVVLAARMTTSLLAVAVAIAAARLARTSTRSGGWVFLATAIAALVAIQLGYYAVDAFSDYRLRAVHALVLIAAGIGLAVLIRSGDRARLQLGPIAAAGLLTVAVLQFAPFHADYLTGFRARGNTGPVSSKPAFQTLIERARDESAPAIYLGWPYALGELYWRFYALENQREDLLARTIPDLDFKPDRIKALPRGSLVITTPSPTIDAAIDGMMARGELRTRELIRDVDGTPTFWILETGRP